MDTSPVVEEEIESPSKRPRVEIDISLEFHLVKTIVHLMLKSAYELVRECKIALPKVFYQLEADMYFLYTSSVFLITYFFSGNSGESDYKILYKEELHSLSGLFNEIMSSAETRIVGGQKIQSLDESIMLTISEVNFQKLFN